jgi:hypothetical protein
MKARKKTGSEPKANSPEKKSFVCQICERDQNIDQTIHIKRKICVTCFNKAQVYEKVEKKIAFFEQFLKKSGKFTTGKKKIISQLRIANSFLPSADILDVREEDLTPAITDLQRKAITLGLKEILSQYQLPEFKDDNITVDVLKSLRTAWKYKTKTPAAQMQNVINALGSIFPGTSINSDQIPKILGDLRKTAKIEAFQVVNGKSAIKKIPFEKLDPTALTQAILKNRKLVLKTATPFAYFKEMVTFLAESCQFQTMDEILGQKFSEFVKQKKAPELERLKTWLLNNINLQENAPLLPNVANFVLENSYQIFYTWFTDILGFDKTRFAVFHPKAMSRTDFAVQLQYRYTKAELKLISDLVRDNITNMIQNKAALKIAKIQKDPSLDPEKKKQKIQSENDYLAKDLQPDRIQNILKRELDNVPQIARFLVLYAERAINMILTQIMEWHYKRLNWNVSVVYVSNISKSSAEKVKGEWVVNYWISSREL